MTTSQIYILLGVGILLFLLVALYFAWPFLTGGHVTAQVKSMTGGPKVSGVTGMSDMFSRVSKTGIEGEEVKMTDTNLTLEKKLKYGQWKMSKIQYRIYCAVISGIFFLVALVKLNMMFQVAVLFAGPVVMNSFLMRSVNKRFKLFDRDYAPFLLSLVGLLKTGMNPLQALGAAAHGLEDGSLVRLEVEVMLERLRLGVPEERSIGAFGEDVNHPEIELFVQALLLSRRVGGTLSDTLDRLARQVRRRQYFRSQAVAAVGLQRGSIWFILGIQAGLMVYIYLIVPEFVTESVASPVGWQIWQGGVLVMALGMYWVRQVSNIRV